MMKCYRPREYACFPQSSASEGTWAGVSDSSICRVHFCLFHFIWAPQRRSLIGRGARSGLSPGTLSVISTLGTCSVFVCVSVTPMFPWVFNIVQSGMIEMLGS